MHQGLEKAVVRWNLVFQRSSRSPGYLWKSCDTKASCSLSHTGSKSLTSCVLIKRFRKCSPESPLLTKYSLFASREATYVHSGASTWTAYCHERISLATQSSIQHHPSCTYNYHRKCMFHLSVCCCSVLLWYSTKFGKSATTQTSRGQNHTAQSLTRWVVPCVR